MAATKDRVFEELEKLAVGRNWKHANSVYQIKRQLFARSERVKGIDFHPTEPWILTTLYNGMTTSPVSSTGTNTLNRPCLHLVI
jgi:hypothetical protein